jgi:hypothetical protein
MYVTLPIWAPIGVLLAMFGPAPKKPWGRLRDGQFSQSKWFFDRQMTYVRIGGWIVGGCLALIILIALCERSPG